jgi:prepilin-type N-terminal cleavage/methylation domain-containing protein
MTGCERTRGDAHGFSLIEVLVVIVILAAVAALVVPKVDHIRDDAELTAARVTMQTLREAFTDSAAGPGHIADMKHTPTFNAVTLRPHLLLVQAAQPAFDPIAQRGWRGPYLRNAQGVANTNTARNGTFPAATERRFVGDATFLERGFFSDGSNSPYGITGELTAADPWGNPIVVQVPPASAFDAADIAERFRYARLVSAGPDGVLSTPLDHRLAGMLADHTVVARGDDLVVFLNRADTYEIEAP